MSQRFIWMPLAAAVTLAACSSEEPAPPSGSAAQTSPPQIDTAAVAPSAASGPAASESQPPAAAVAAATPPAGDRAAQRQEGEGGAGGEAGAPAADAAGRYDVDCPDGAQQAEQCQVSKDVYVGWRTYSSQCFQCHGGSGMGTTFAPNLMDRLNAGVDRERFKDVVLNGYRGQMGAMPAWRGNPQVEPHLDELWLYLRARADGALPPGRPARKQG